VAVVTVDCGGATARVFTQAIPGLAPPTLPEYAAVCARMLEGIRSMDIAKDSTVISILWRGILKVAKVHGKKLG
jgi:hypothetical protein